MFSLKYIVLSTLATVATAYFTRKIYIHQSCVNHYNPLSILGYRFLMKISYCKNKIDKRIKQAKENLQKEFISNTMDEMLVLSIPEKPMLKDVIIDRLHRLQKDDCKWKEGRAFGYIYHGGEEHSNLLNTAYEMYAHTNPLHASAFLSVRILESEVIRMTARMLNGDDSTCGTMTSGGSESIILAVKAARDYFLSKRPNSKPEMICCNTVHAAFIKAAKYFDIKVIITKLDKDYRANPDLYSRNITSNTMMMVVSAPCYPYGIIDRIEEISQLACKNKIWLHVDSCLGGFVLPWMEEAGYSIPKFDFSLPGVTTISCDTHKYGYSSKGSSVILYRNPDYRKYQYFCWSKWTGGLFASPSITGSRPGGIISAAWTSLVSIGRSGYINYVRELMGSTVKLQKAINEIDEIIVIGQPNMCVFAFKSNNNKLDIFVLADNLENKGWFIERQQNPNSLHLTITLRHTKIIDEFICDLMSSIRESIGIRPSGKAAIYGSAVAITNPEVIDDILIHYTGLVNDGIDNCGILAIT